LARSRAAEHDQLSATASLIISMTTRKCVAELSEVQNGDPLRLITLEISGRGPLSNQTVWLSSQGPLMYESLDKRPEAKPSEESLSPMESQVVLAIGRQPKDSDQIMCELNSGNPASIRNCITRLRRKGMVVVMSAESRRRRYCLTSNGLKAFEDLRKAKKCDALDAHADLGSNSALQV
jgi:predicted transcriptional regulator